ncbi:MAG: nucleoside hydrolase, partial [Bacillota bacterium]|nr:nucleoside hydrolase [Bacillota bacterium]
VASALKLNPNIKENIVIVWLGGHARECSDTKEFNLWQDVAASRVIFGSGAPIVQLPCMGVVSDFSITEPILKANLSLKNELCDYLLTHTIDECKKFFNTASFSKVIWDVTAVAWLLNDNDKFMESRITDVLMPGYDGYYEKVPLRIPMRYVTRIFRDKLFEDLFLKLSELS